MIVWIWMMVQVIGESLPISSSGHVMLLQKMFENIRVFNFFELSDGKLFLQILSLLLMGYYFLRCSLPELQKYWSKKTYQPFAYILLYDVLVFFYNPFLWKDAIVFKAGLDLHNLSRADIGAFDYCIQGISACVIFCYFFPRWWNVIVQQPINFSAFYNLQLWTKTIPAIFIFGVVADGVTFLFWYFDVASYLPIPLSLGFMMTGICLWSLQFAQEKNDINVWSPQYALLLGLVQGCALFPGVSRFACTVTALAWLGYERSTAFAISFLLQWPLLVAGSIKGFLYLKSTGLLDIIFNETSIGACLFVAFISYKVLQYVGKLIEKNIVWKISYYMVLPTAIALLL